MAGTPSIRSLMPSNDIASGAVKSPASKKGLSSNAGGRRAVEVVKLQAHPCLTIAVAIKLSERTQRRKSRDSEAGNAIRPA